MSAARWVRRALTVLLVVGALLLVAGQLLGQPLLFGYVTTGSMEPALSAGDGFVAVPPPLAGEPQVGDVVVFEAREIQGGGLTTHRIVGETADGYVTSGDANPFTDQDAGEPHLSEDDVLAHAMQVDGRVVAIPHLGTGAMGLQGAVAVPFAVFGEERAGTVLVVVGIALFLVAGTLQEGRRTARTTSRENVVAVWSVVLVVTLVLTTAATAAMVAPAGTYQIEVVATDDPAEDPQVVPPGETATASYQVHHGGVVPTLVVTDPAESTTRVDPAHAVLGFDDRTAVTVSMRAPEEAGEYTYQVRESRYLLVLPAGVLLALHSIHPLLALLAVDLTIALFVVAGCVAVLGTGYLRLRPGADVPLRIRLERKIRRWLG